MAKPVQPLTAKSIREFGRTNPEFVKSLPENLRSSFDSGKRGRMPVAVRVAASKAMGRKPHVEGTPKTVEVSFKRNGRKVTKFIPETQARTLAGDVAGKRGPLSAKALAAAGEAFAKTLIGR